MDAANCAAVLYCQCQSAALPRLYSATGRACRRKWHYIKYTPLPLPFFYGATGRVLPATLTVVMFVADRS